MITIRDFKRLALSPPLTHADYDAVSEEAIALIEKHGLLHFHETNMDLPEPERFEWILIASKQKTIDEYLKLRSFCREQLSIHNFCMPTNARGIYPGNPLLDPILEELNQQYTVVALHPVQPSAVPEDVCELLPLPFMEFFFDTTRAVANMVLHGILHRYPNIKIIIPHAGAYLPILSDRLATLPKVLPADAVDSIDTMAEGLSVMEDLRDFYYDLGGIVVPKQLGVLRKMAVDSHILYGSDIPFTPVPVCRKLASDLGNVLEEDIAGLVYQENPKRLLKIAK